jgi:hypothetical protein
MLKKKLVPGGYVYNLDEDTSGAVKQEVHKKKQVFRDVEDEYLDENTRPELKHYQMHKTSIINWLRKRHLMTTDTRHLYLPRDLMKHIELKNIFLEFDDDGSCNNAPH